MICSDPNNFLTVDLALKNASIVTYESSEGRSLVSPIKLKNGATLNLELDGNNTLTGCYGGAAIAVPKGCTLNNRPLQGPRGRKL